MALDLPAPLGTYFNAGNGPDIAQLTQCFAEDARVLDEGEWRQGHEEITRWAQDARAKYNFISTPLAMEGPAQEPIVTARVEGNFPGSPIELRYRFVLAEGKIASLSIA
ncbi:MAG: hypothetical protein BGO57_14575 [Sphingomonadales bacterium 63-6]|nr:MAG: hypothetical protein BGO57_14575 [Sphingomonadales bacterium 63-6]